MVDSTQPVESAAGASTGAPSNRIWTADFLKISLVNTASFSSFNMLTITMPLYVVVIGGSESDVGLIMGVFSITAVASRPFVGAALDRFGRKSVLLVAVIGLVVASFSYLAAFSLLVLFFVRALQGIAYSGAVTTTAAYVGDIVPPQRRAEGVGYFGMFSNGTFAVVPWISLQIANLAGFTIMFAAAVAVAVAGVITTLSLRKLPPPIKPAEARHWFERLINPKAFRPGLIVLCLFIAFSAQLVFCRSTRPSGISATSVCTLAAYAVASVVGRLVTGKFADRYERGAAVIPGLVLAFASMIAMSLAVDMVLVIVAGALMGAAFALVTPALQALVVDVTATADRGSAMATFAAGLDAGFGIGSFLWGFVIKQVGYESMYLWGSIVPLLGIVAYFVFVYGKMKPVDPMLAQAPPAAPSR